MAKIGSCTTKALHCVGCGKPSELMQGALSECCEKRVTRASTCEGDHPIYEVLPGATDDDVDLVLVPHLLSLVQSLVAGGRMTDQALDDLDRALGILSAQLHVERMELVERTGELPST